MKGKNTKSHLFHVIYQEDPNCFLFKSRQNNDTAQDLVISVIRYKKVAPLWTQLRQEHS